MTTRPHPRLQNRRGLLRWVLLSSLVLLISYPARVLVTNQLVNRAVSDLIINEAGRAERLLTITRLFTPFNRRAARYLVLLPASLGSSGDRLLLLQTLRDDGSLPTALHQQAKARLALFQNSEELTGEVALTTAVTALGENEPLLTLQLLADHPELSLSRDYWQLRGDALLREEHIIESSRLIRRRTTPLINQAIAAYETALSFDITNQTIIEKLAPLYKSTGQSDKATALEGRLK